MKFATRAPEIADCKSLTTLPTSTARRIWCPSRDPEISRGEQASRRSSVEAKEIRLRRFGAGYRQPSSRRIARWRLADHLYVAGTYIRSWTRSALEHSHWHGRNGRSLRYRDALAVVSCSRAVALNEPRSSSAAGWHGVNNSDEVCREVIPVVLTERQPIAIGTQPPPQFRLLPQSQIRRPPQMDRSTAPRSPIFCDLTRSEASGSGW